MDVHILIEEGAVPLQHEITTYVFLVKKHKKPKFLAKKDISNVTSPDIFMDDMEWEMKSPIGSGRENLEHAFKAAVKQAENIIFDLRRSKIPDQKAITKLRRELSLSRKAKRLYVITKDEELLFFEK